MCQVPFHGSCHILLTAVLHGHGNTKMPRECYGNGGQKLVIPAGIMGMGREHHRREAHEYAAVDGLVICGILTMDVKVIVFMSFYERFPM